MSKNVISQECNAQGHSLRQVRSFVRRHGRITKRQQYALDTLWLEMGTDYQAHPLHFTRLFGRVAPIILEIGFGMGTSLVTMAAEHPDQDFIGIEVYLPGIGACLASAKEANVNNLRVIYHDAVEVLDHMIPQASLSLVQVFFPDPWHKARHNKRRIIQAPFVDLVSRKLTAGGVFHIATDWKPYADYMLSVMSDSVSFLNLSNAGNYVPRPVCRPFTKFEKRGQQLGYSILDLMFLKTV